MIKEGASSLKARTGDITLSGPGWASMLTGVWREKHGVRTNDFKGHNPKDYPHFFHDITIYDFRDEVNVEVLGHIFERSIGDLQRHVPCLAGTLEARGKLWVAELLFQKNIKVRFAHS